MLAKEFIVSSFRKISSYKPKVCNFTNKLLHRFFGTTLMVAFESWIFTHKVSEVNKKSWWSEFGLHHNNVNFCMWRKEHGSGIRKFDSHESTYFSGNTNHFLSKCNPYFTFEDIDNFWVQIAVFWAYLSASLSGRWMFFQGNFFYPLAAINFCYKFWHSTQYISFTALCGACL